MIGLNIAYNPNTELRCVQPNDMYKLAVILDENDGWKKLMEIIPKDINKKVFCAFNLSKHKFDELNANGRKYNNDHVRLLENATGRLKETRLFSQILFDEWSTSGRKSQRPTLGITLTLLVKSQEFRAADFITENLLKETLIQRPVIGPAAKVDISLPNDIFHDIENVISDSYYNPNTDILNENQQYVLDNNEDFYTKHKLANKQIYINDNIRPKPPPRLQKLAKIKTQQEYQQQLKRHQNENKELLDKGGNIIENTSEISVLKNSVGSTDSKFTNGAESINLTQVTTINSLLHNNSLSIRSLTRNKSNANDKGNISENEQHTNISLPFLSLLNLDVEVGKNSLSNSINADDHLSSNRQISPKINSSKHTENVHIEVSHVNNNCDRDTENDDNGNSIPNLSIFERITFTNNPTLTNIIATSRRNNVDFSLRNKYCDSFE